MLKLEYEFGLKLLGNDLGQVFWPNIKVSSTGSRRSCTSAQGRARTKDEGQGQWRWQRGDILNVCHILLSPLTSLLHSLAECPYHLRQIRRQLYYNNIYFENMLECALWCCCGALLAPTVPHTQVLPVCKSNQNILSASVAVSKAEMKLGSRSESLLWSSNF